MRGDAERLALDETITPEPLPRVVKTAAGTAETVAAGTTAHATGAEPSRSDEPASAVEQQELASDIHRFHSMLILGLPLWWVFLALDWLIVTYIEPGRLWYYALLRLIGFVPLLLATLRLRREPLPSRRVFDVLSLLCLSETIAIVALMTLEYRGIASPYAAGVIVIVVIRGIVLAAPWRHALVHMLVPALVYPAVLLGAALFSPAVAAQFRDGHDLASFLQYQFFSLGVVGVMTWGSHTVWAYRRQAFENRSIGRYRLERRIGSGGMGEVWRAYDKTLKRRVALKLLRPDRRSAASVARFEREAEATSLLSHPNTVRIFDYGVTHDGMWYYAMELLEGRNLAEVVASSGALAPARARHLVRHAARALAEAHSQGLVHRDIKPENLFVATLGGEEDVVKVLDFGIVKLLEEDGGATLTHGDWLGGTPAYMSPEAARGGHVDSRSDVYGLGGVLYFALTGRPPFRADNLPALLDAQIHQQVVAPSRVRGEPVPEQLEAIVMRCLSKDPAQRYADAAALAEALGSAPLP